MEIKTSKQIEEAVKQKDTFFKIEEGKTTLRVVSSIHGVKEHKIKVGDNFRFVICPIAMEQWEADSEERPANKSVKCPVCEKGEKKVVTQFLAIAVDDKGNAGVLKKGTTVFTPITDLRDAGYDLSKTQIIITRKGAGLDTEYSVIPHKVEKPLTEEEQQAVLDFEGEFSLEQRTAPMSYENIVRKLNGEDLVFDDVSVVPTKDDVMPEELPF